ncbi:MAG: AMP-binding protein, partial [Acidobacteriota bacterium]
MTISTQRLDTPRTSAYDRTKTIWHLIEARAQEHPDRLAIVDGVHEIDYRRVMRRANAIAGELAARQVSPGSLVAVCVQRTWNVVPTLLGVLRAGCAYLPLDRSYPRERLRFMLEHSRAVAALVDDEEAADVCAEVPTLLRLDEVAEPTADRAAVPLNSDLAYVMYTSGSTGRPKGVAIEHRSITAMSHS